MFTVRWSAFLAPSRRRAWALEWAWALGGCEWAAGGDAFFCVFFVSSGMSQAFKCYPSMPGPNLGASQIGLVLIDVPFVCLWLKKGIEIQNECWTDKWRGKCRHRQTHARTHTLPGEWVLETMVKMECVVTKKIRRKNLDGTGAMKSRVATTEWPSFALLGRPVQFHGKCKLQSPSLVVFQ